MNWGRGDEAVPPEAVGIPPLPRDFLNDFERSICTVLSFDIWQYTVCQNACCVVMIK